jgi:YidC/Oxa1 family membrane protein insertase
MSDIWLELLRALGVVLRFFHDVTVGLLGGYAWVAAIVLLTVVVRLVMMPLAVRQFRSMQAMQRLRPEMKRIQQRYKTDRGMMRTDPEKYRGQRQKQQEEMMALYKEHNVNPASSCLPLIAQMPIFIALFSVLRSPDVIPELVTAPFPVGATLQQPASQAGIVAIVLLVLMGVTTFVQQKQMMGRTAAVADDQQLQQQKMMLYIMPVFLTVLGFQLPVGVLVYWVTTNLWQMGQQWYMLREMAHADERAREAKRSGSKGSKKSGPEQPSRGQAAPKSAGSKSQGSKSDKKPPRTRRGKTAQGKGGDAQDAANRNGHRPGGPKNIRKKRNRDETGDKRR